MTGYPDSLKVWRSETMNKEHNMDPTTEYYFESHITIDPILDNDRLAAVKEAVAPLGFRVAKLLLQKGLISNLDSFMTARDKDYATILKNTQNAVALLKQEGYGVRRYKIENILLDVNC